MGVFKLGKMTFGSLFKKPETVLYPVQMKPQPAGLKGHIALDVSTCILCGMCDRSCATNCITVNKQEAYWEIDRFQCVQCGYCITVCPKKSLSMDPNYAPASVERTPDRIAVPVQAKEPKQTATEQKPEAKAEVEAKAAGVAAQQAANEAAVEPISGVTRDDELEAKLVLMDGDKAQRVRDALAARTA